MPWPNPNIFLESERANEKELILLFFMIFLIFLGDGQIFWVLFTKREIEKLAHRNMFISVYNTWFNSFCPFWMFVAVFKIWSLKLLCLFVCNCRHSKKKYALSKGYQDLNPTHEIKFFFPANLDGLINFVIRHHCLIRKLLHHHCATFPWEDVQASQTHFFGNSTQDNTRDSKTYYILVDHFQKKIISTGKVQGAPEQVAGSKECGRIAVRTWYTLQNLSKGSCDQEVTPHCSIWPLPFGDILIVSMKD